MAEVTTKTPVTTYGSTYIMLHWFVALLVLAQLVFGGQMTTAFNAMMTGRIAAPGTGPGLGDAFVHGLLGSIIGLLMLGRLYLRLTHPIPPPAPGWAGTVSRINHWLFYILLVGMPIAGLATWFGGLERVGDVHALASQVLIALIALHIIGALYHHVVQKDRTILRRMAPRQADPRA